MRLNPKSHIVRAVHGRLGCSEVAGTRLAEGNITVGGLLERRAYQYIH